MLWVCLGGGHEDLGQVALQMLEDNSGHPTFLCLWGGVQDQVNLRRPHVLLLCLGELGHVDTQAQACVGLQSLLCVLHPHWR